MKKHLVALGASAMLLAATTATTLAGTSEFQLADGSPCWSANTTLSISPYFDHVCSNGLWAGSPSHIEGTGPCFVMTYDPMWTDLRAGSALGQDYHLISVVDGKELTVCP